MGAERQRPFLLKDYDQSTVRGTTAHGYLMVTWIIIASFANSVPLTAIPLNSWCWLWVGAEGMWDGLHQKAVPRLGRGGRGGHELRLGRADLRGRGRGAGGARRQPGKGPESHRL